MTALSDEENEEEALRADKDEQEDEVVVEKDREDGGLKVEGGKFLIWTAENWLKLLKTTQKVQDDKENKIAEGKNNEEK